jgi:hypothetical protein
MTTPYTNQTTSESPSCGAACSLPSQLKGPFYGAGMGKIFIHTKCGDTTVLDVRGWGYLTGRGGGLAMAEDDAVKVQDQFEAWVIAALNYYAENVQGHGLSPVQSDSTSNPASHG